MAKKESLRINPREIDGNWRAGWALDVHTLSSRLLPDNRYDTERTDNSAERLLFDLKICRINAFCWLMTSMTQEQL